MSNKPKKQLGGYLAYALLLTTASLTVLLLHEQTVWADIIHCSGTSVCNGTSDDDIMFGAGPVTIIHGLGVMILLQVRDPEGTTSMAMKVTIFCMEQNLTIT